MSDTVADFLTRIRNSFMAKHRYTDVVLSKLNKSMAEVLKKKGFIASYIENEKKHILRVFLKYDANRNPIIHNLKRVSKPGCRRYVKATEIPRVLGGLGCALLSTSKGIMDGITAQKEKLGGEHLCNIW